MNPIFGALSVLAFVLLPWQTAEAPCTVNSPKPETVFDYFSMSTTTALPPTTKPSLTSDSTYSISGHFKFVPPATPTRPYDVVLSIYSQNNNYLEVRIARISPTVNEIYIVYSINGADGPESDRKQQDPTLPVFFVLGKPYSNQTATFPRILALGLELRITISFLSRVATCLTKLLYFLQVLLSWLRRSPRL